MNNNQKHALLAPSSAHRWLVCTPSARLEEAEEAKYTFEPSVYAKEGTEAHSLSEIKLSFMLGKISADEYDTKFEQFRLSSEYYDTEFNDFVNEFCNEVMTIIKFDYEGEVVDVYLESEVEFTDLVPYGKGTCDVAIVGKNFIHVVDLKFGRGVPVSAINNPQLRLYGLGAIRKYGRNKVITDVRMTIHQPRLHDKTTEHMSYVDLESWGQTYVKPRAELAYNGDGELVPGDHCKFCKRQGICEALGQQQLEVAQAEFETAVVVQDNTPRVLKPSEMSPDQLSRILTIAPKFVEWFNEVNKWTVAQMINNGLEVPGYKVVEGRSNRAITSPDSIAQKLKEAGFSEDLYLKKPDLLGITALEKNIGSKLFNTLCGEYIIKPMGKPTLAEETDSRPALGTSQFRLVGQEFDDEKEN